MNRTSRTLTMPCTALALAAMAASAAASDATTRVSVDSAGGEGDAASGTGSRPAVSADGRHVAFASSATNLVANDSNGVDDVFVHDRQTGTTVRVSVSSAGVQANGASGGPALSRDGRFVAFESVATNLVAIDTNLTADVFVHDRDPDANGIFDEGNGVTTRVSLRAGAVQGNAASRRAAISADGNLVAFASDASNLVASDRNGVTDVFVRDRAASTTTRVSVDSAGIEGDGASDRPAISADGAFVAFESLAANLVAGDLNGVADLFVRDRVNGTTTRASVDSSGAEANGASRGPPSLSSDGSIVAFHSSATNLVASDLNGVADVFVRDRAAGVTTRASVSSSGGEGNRDSRGAALSADGMQVAFESDADLLATGDGNQASDAFVHDRATGKTWIVSSDCAGNPGNGASSGVALSGDGLIAAYASVASDLVAGDANGVSDVFVHDEAAEVDAGWRSYGAGYPGTLGIPALVAQNDPELGSTLVLDIGNSLGLWTVGFLFAGLSEASLPTSLGGTFLLGDRVLTLPLPIAPAGSALAADLPRDEAVCGLYLYVQVLELDDGATWGVSFTPGLELLFGR